MEKINPSKRRSKEWITESLLSLMNNKSFSEITVKEITEEADLVRQTFYRNFETKEEVLKEYILNIMSRAFNEVVIKDIHDTKEMGRIWFAFLSQHKRLLELLYENKILSIFLDLSATLIDELNREIKGDYMKDYDDASIKYYNAFNQTGFLSMITVWIENGFKESPEKLGELYEMVLTDNPHIRYKLNKN